MTLSKGRILVLVKDAKPIQASTRCHSSFESRSDAPLPFPLRHSGITPWKGTESSLPILLAFNFRFLFCRRLKSPMMKRRANR